MRFGIFMVLMWLATTVSYADESKQISALNLSQAIARVLDNNLQTGINRFKAKAMAARIRQAQQSTPVEMTLEIENFSGTGRFKNTDQLETTLSLSKVFESGNKPALRGELAKQQALQLSNQQDSQHLDLLARVAQQFIHVVVNQQRLKIANDHLALVKHTYQTISKRVAAGKSHRAEKRQLAIDVARSEIKAKHAQHELMISRLKLASHWGETQPQFSRAQASLFSLPDIDDFSRLETLLTSNPDLVHLATEERIAQSKQRLAELRRSYDLSISGGARYLSESNDTT
ncbi:MAG: TolC family protein, partial [Gammaproteobacteria bacterium]|nr:TolC family protein [Gammaproteobacteria bacterium]